MNPSFTESAYRLRVFLYRFRKRLLRGFFIPFALFVAVSFVPTPRYVAESVLVVRLGPEYVYQPEAARTPSTPNSPIPFDRTQMVKSEMALLRSSDLHAAVIEALGADALFPEISSPTIPAIRAWFASPNASDDRKKLAQASALFDRRFEVTVEKDSAVMTLGFSHRDDAIAAQTLTTLLKLYFDKRQELYRATRSDLAEQMLATKREEAQHAAAALEAFKQQHRIYAFEEQRGELLRQRDQAQAMATSITHGGLTRKIAALDRELSALNAVEAEFKSLQSEAQAAQNAVTLFTQNRDEARALEERLAAHTQSVRVVQTPTSGAEPKSAQALILILGAVISLLSALITAIYSDSSYDTGKVVSILKQRKQRLMWRAK